MKRVGTHELLIFTFVLQSNRIPSRNLDRFLLTRFLLPPGFWLSSIHSPRLSSPATSVRRLLGGISLRFPSPRSPRTRDWHLGTFTAVAAGLSHRVSCPSLSSERPVPRSVGVDTGRCHVRASLTTVSGWALVRATLSRVRRIEGKGTERARGGQAGPCCPPVTNGVPTPGHSLGTSAPDKQDGHEAGQGEGGDRQSMHWRTTALQVFVPDYCRRPPVTRTPACAFDGGLLMQSWSQILYLVRDALIERLHVRGHPSGVLETMDCGSGDCFGLIMAHAIR